MRQWEVGSRGMGLNSECSGERGALAFSSIRWLRCKSTISGARFHAVVYREMRSYKHPTTG